MLPDPMFLSAQQRMQSFLQEAEERRLLKRAAKLDKPICPISHIQWWLGNQLVNWGTKMRQYHGATVPQFSEVLQHDEPALQ